MGHLRSFNLRRRSQQSIGNALVSSLLGALLLAGCGQGHGSVDRGNNRNADDEDARETEDNIILEGEKEAEEEIQGGCTRALRLDAVTVGDGAPFDVIIVADHSDSLSWSRDELSTGLSDFLVQVRGHEVRFYVLTPTQYGATSEASYIPFYESDAVQWRDPESGEAYENPMTEYTQLCLGEGGLEVDCPTTLEEITEPYSLTGTWNFRTPVPVGTITPDMDDAGVELQRQAVSDAILGLGLGGASDEQPVCTLHRFLAQEPSLLPEHAVFLILSDEDDKSSRENCLVGQEMSASFREEFRTFTINGSAVRSTVRYTCHPEDDQGELIGTPLNRGRQLNEECTAERACSKEELASSLAACPTDHQLTECSVPCVESGVGCWVQETATVTDACNSPFEHLGQSYNNLQDLCSSRHPSGTDWECTSSDWEGELIKSYTPLPISYYDMTVEFRTRADSIFGADGYSVQLIGFDPSFTCSPEPGQEYLDKLKGLVDSDAQIFPICGDYAGALSDARDFATQLVETEYVLELGEDEQLAAVRVVSEDGSVRELAPEEYELDEASDTLRIQQGSLRSKDRKIDLDVLEACEIR